MKVTIETKHPNKIMVLPGWTCKTLEQMDYHGLLFPISQLKLNERSINFCDPIRRKECEKLKQCEYYRPNCENGERDFLNISASEYGNMTRRQRQAGIAKKLRKFFDQCHGVTIAYAPVVNLPKIAEPTKSKDGKFKIGDRVIVIRNGKRHPASAKITRFMLGGNAAQLDKIIGMSNVCHVSFLRKVLKAKPKSKAKMKAIGMVPKWVHECWFKLEKRKTKKGKK